MSDVKQNERTKAEKNRKVIFYVNTSSFRNVSHKTTRKSSTKQRSCGIVQDHSGQCPVQHMRILDRQLSNLID